MEQRISYTRGFDLPVAAAGRAIPYNGGCFSTDNPTGLLQGSADGFVASILVRPRSSHLFGGNPGSAPLEFLAGSYDFNNQNGYAFVYAQDGNNDVSVVRVFAGAVENDVDVYPERDTLISLIALNIPGVGASAGIFANGEQVSAFAPTLADLTGPSNFGIGGTVDPTFAAAEANSYGALSCGIGGFLMAPALDFTPALQFLASGYILQSIMTEQYAAVQNALDVVDTPAGNPAATLGVVVTPAVHTFSTRRGLPQLVNDGNEIWGDEVGNVNLSRVGQQINASVDSKAPVWSQTLDNIIASLGGE